MKKIAMFTMGTRGDVQPYIYLAQELTDRGCEVTIGTHPCWEKLVRGAGIQFAPIGPDIDIEKEAAIIRGKTRNPIISILKTMNFVLRIIENSSSDIYKVCEGQDMVVISHSNMGDAEADALKIPTVSVVLQHEMIPLMLKEKSFKDKMLGKLIAGPTTKPYNKIRKLYALEPVKDLGEKRCQNTCLVPISKYVLERNPYWSPNVVLCGYWYREEPDYQPDERLAAFLNAGAKPVILALGAMSFEDSSDREKLDAFVNAFKKTGERAIIQGFNKTLQNYDLPDDMLAVGSVPHSYLFRQGKLVIHHCGFGTASASLIYGIPSIPVPHVLDQSGFAKTLTELGVACEPLNGNAITEADVISAINAMNDSYEQKKARVEELSDKIRTENGLQRAAELILNDDRLN